MRCDSGRDISTTERRLINKVVGQEVPSELVQAIYAKYCELYDERGVRIARLRDLANCVGKRCVRGATPPEMMARETGLALVGLLPC